MDAAREALDAEAVDIVMAADWADGMGASLRAGLSHLLSAGSTADAALVHLVDLPDVGAPVVARVAELAGPAVLARAAYASGVPGHPCSSAVTTGPASRPRPPATGGRGTTSMGEPSSRSIARTSQAVLTWTGCSDLSPRAAAAVVAGN
ncbi:MAG: NTP transferase domain-containing protein [Nocardioidaceae bacterium]